MLDYSVSVNAKTVNVFKTKLSEQRMQKICLTFSRLKSAGLRPSRKFRSGDPASILRGSWLNVWVIRTVVVGQHIRCNPIYIVSQFRVSNTPRNPGNLLEIYSLLEIFWFSLRVFAFVVNISYNSCISECISTKYLAENQDQLILKLVISVSVS